MKLLIFALMMISSSLAADVPIQAVDAIFDGLITPGEPGAALLVIRDNTTILQRNYGVADLHSGQKIDERTNFRLASLTKQFTAMAVMLLVHDGKIRYEESLSDVLPEFCTYGQTITIRNLLNHTAGLVDYEDIMARPYGGNLPGTIPQIRDAGVSTLLQKEKSTTFPPGSHWHYSNSAYAVLAMIVEQASGKPFGQFLHDRVFEPLGMTETIAFEKGKNQVANRAYGNSKSGGHWLQTDQSPTSAVLGDGGIYSSLRDLGRWDRALSQHKLLSAAAMQPALTPVQVSVQGPDDRPAAYGFGWFLDAYKGHKRMWHYGETVGFRTAIQRFPEDRLTVIVLCNRSDIAAQDVALKVADLFLAH